MSGDGGDADSSLPGASMAIAADSDVDFLAEADEAAPELQVAVPGDPAGAEAEADEAPAAPELQVAVPGDPGPGVEAVLRPQPQPQESIYYGKPGERTPVQHALLTARMREKRAQNQYRKACTAQAADLKNQFNDLIAKNAVPTRTAMSLQVPRWLSGTHKRRHVKK